LTHLLAGLQTVQKNIGTKIKSQTQLCVNVPTENSSANKIKQ